MQASAIKRLFNNEARFFGIVAAASAACTPLALSLSVPYRIHQGIYTWSLCAAPLMVFTVLVSLVAVVFAFVLG